MKIKSLVLFLFSVCLFSPASVFAEVVENTALENTAVASVQPNYSLDINSLSLEERKWFKTFQEGTLLIDGWQDIVEKLLANTPEELRGNQKKHLDQLGLKIGLEWSKDNAVRRVDSRMLQQWGKTLKKTAMKNPEQLSEVIVFIDQEVDDILN